MTEFASVAPVPAKAGARVEPTAGGRAERLVLPLALLIAFALTLVRANPVLADPDTLWHVALGHWMIAHRAISMIDTFSFTVAGQPWVDHEWLSELMLSGAYGLGSWTAVVLMTGMVFALSITLAIAFVARRLPWPHAILFGLLTNLLLLPHLMARPHLLAFPLLLIWLDGLARAAEAKTSPPLALALLFVPWANMHASFVMGLAVAPAFALETLIAVRGQSDARRILSRWALLIALATGASLLTPFGWRGFAFAADVASLKYQLAHITEWRSPDFQQLQPLEIWLFLFLAAALGWGWRLPPVRLLLLLGFLHLALAHVRYADLVALAVPLVLAAPVAANWRVGPGRAPELGTALGTARLWTASLAGILVLCGLYAAVAAPRPASANMPVAALDAAGRAGLTGHVFNHYNFGGYLLYAGVPAFIDGRAILYGDPFFKEYTEAVSLASSNALPDLLAKYDIAWTLLPPGTPAIALLDRLPGWHRVYAGEVAVVHARD